MNPASMAELGPTITWVPFASLERLFLALLLGLFVGLEREWRGKEAGLRTHALASLLGAMGAMAGTPYALVCLGLIGVLVVFLNVQSMRSHQGTELTTSVALFVTTLAGVLCGVGHVITPVAVAVVTAGLLSWKEYLAKFGHSLTAEEIRSAVLLGILAFAVYPLLPAHPVDPWGLIEPRTAWFTVVLIAAIGFANYILWKLFGTRGIEFAGFLGGLVNSTVTVSELSSRVDETDGQLIHVAYRGVLLSIAAMTARNALILGIFKPAVLLVAAGSLGLMLAASVGLALIARRPPVHEGEEKPLALKSPFSLRSALKFGVIFLVLQVSGTLAQATFGRFGFYAVSVVGGLVSSASAVAAAAILAAHDTIPASVAGVGSVLASLASAAVNVILVARFSGSRALTVRTGVATLIIVLLGLVGALVTARWAPTG
jgi:uncharacterized membrane protein (DUF4010 family)